MNTRETKYELIFVTCHSDEGFQTSRLRPRGRDRSKKKLSKFNPLNFGLQLPHPDRRSYKFDQHSQLKIVSHAIVLYLPTPLATFFVSCHNDEGSKV